jgi:chaperonin GroES
MLKPILGRIIVKQKNKEEITSGGIVIPESIQENSLIGEIVELGPGPIIGDRIMPFSEIGLFKGDTVVYMFSAGTRVQYRGIEYRVLMHHDVQFVVGDISDLGIASDLNYQPEFGVDRDVT